VVVGERSHDDAEILSGLRGGERVVTQGAYGVADGSRIVAPGEQAEAPDGAKPEAP
jgi:hypothetical protein